MRWRPSTRSSLGRGLLLAGFHLLMATVIAFALAHEFGFTGTQRGVFILMCLMPVSVATYLFVSSTARSTAAMSPA